MFRTIFSFSASYAIVEVFQKGLMFVVMSFFTYYMTTTEYGVISSALMIVQFLSVIFSLSTSASISRYYFKYMNDSELLKEFLGSLFILMFSSGVIFFFLSVLLGERIFSYFFPEIVFDPDIIIILAVCIFQPFNLAYLALLKSKELLKRYTIIYSIFYLSQIALMTFTVIGLGIGPRGYLLSLLISNILAAIVIVVLLKAETRFTINKKLVTQSVKYSLSFIPNEIFTVVNTIIDRIYILSLLALSALGIYQIGIQIGALLLIVCRSLNYAYLPHFMKLYESDETNYTQIYKFANIFVFIITLFAGYLSILSPLFIEYFLDPSYIDAKEITIYINFMIALYSVYYINVNVLSLSSSLVNIKTICVVSGGLINLLLNYFLIKYFQLVGAAIATLIGFLITNVMLSFAVKTRTEFKFKNNSNILLIALALISLLMIKNISIDNLIGNIILWVLLFTFCNVFIFKIIHKRWPLINFKKF